MRDEHRLGAHLPVLIQAVKLVPGDVLELGAGYLSTPMLHALCCPERRIITLEAKPEWCAPFKYLEGPRHKFVAVGQTPEAWIANLETLRSELTDIGVAFVDQQGDARPPTAIWLRDIAKVILIHDCPRPRRGGISIMAPELQGMRYSRIFAKRFPATAAFSSVVDIGLWEDV